MWLAFSLVVSGCGESVSPRQRSRWTAVGSCQQPAVFAGFQSDLEFTARHLEAAAHLITCKEVIRMCRKWIPVLPQNADRRLPKDVTVESASRVDVFGGWLDTPPITLRTRPSAVINIAVLVDDQKSIRCEVRRVASPAGVTVVYEGKRIVFMDEKAVIDAYNKPANPGSLVCACMVAIGLVSPKGGEILKDRLEAVYQSNGLEIECSSILPHGSGLGTSSILAACVVSALWRVAAIPRVSKQTILHTVLYVEQLLTTGGGWQDQLGGIYPAMKTGFVKEDEMGEDSVCFRQIAVSKEFEVEINRRLILIYTGKTRLAKNLLQEVVRSWFAGGPVVQVVKDLQDGLEAVENSLTAGVFPCELVEKYFEAKQKLATGCQPEIVAKLIRRLKGLKLCETAWMAGAGGGGFLYVWLSQTAQVEDVKNVLQNEFHNMTVHSITIDNDPLVITTSLKRPPGQKKDVNSDSRLVSGAQSRVDFRTSRTSCQSDES